MQCWKQCLTVIEITPDLGISMRRVSLYDLQGTRGSLNCEWPVKANCKYKKKKYFYVALNGLKQTLS